MGKKRCPHCGEPAVRIVYGLPGEELMEAAARGEVVLAGCIVSGDDPQWGCSLCGSQWSTSTDHTTSAISELFANYFERWSITLPPGSEGSGDRGTIHRAGWTICYLFGQDDHERYIEFYASHRMTNDRRHRFYESGRIEHLDAIEELYLYDSKIPGSEEEARRRYLEHNQRVAEELQRLGLYPRWDINAYLRTHDAPAPEEER